MFRTILASGLEPFGELEVEFPPVEDKRADLGEVHLFTGVNGTGKTRLLALMAALLGNPVPLAKRRKGITAQIGVGVTDAFPAEHPSGSPVSWPDVIPWSGAHLHSPWAVGRISTDLSWRERNRLPRPNVKSWLTTVPAFAYYGSPYIGDLDIQTLATVPRPQREACLSFDHEPEVQPLLQAVGNLMVQTALESQNAPSVTDLTRARKLLAALESTLTQITGTDFTFYLQVKPVVSLRVVWGEATLSIDALPDGLRSIIGWMVHALVMMDLCLDGSGDPMQTEAVFLLDEIESHLHPAWQRRVLPAFQHLFPKAQIFVATHSPFVISSLNQGWIYRFVMGPDGKVKIDPPIPAGKGESYISVVEDIMGMKEWFDVETEKLLSEFRAQREKAYAGDPQSAKAARDLALRIGKESMELDFMMGREVMQMERQLAKSVAQK